MYKLGSLFDGSGGFPLAGTLCGIEPVWAAEVEPYPIAVTRSRFPNMKHLGDISKINGADIEPVDIITFGSPCQDLSVAGKRAGLKHEANGDEETTRSGLFMEAVRIIKEMRKATNGQYPRFALWENVPGAFSSNKGEDFRIVCEELIKIVEPSASMPSVPQNGWNYADSYVGDGWSLAYRVFDAQYWGVPQRRRRIHLVADFRGECAREILFEREGLRGYFTQGRTPWQTTPADAQGSTGADDRGGDGAGEERGLGVGGLLERGRLDGGDRGRQLDDVSEPGLSAGFCTEHSAKSRSVGYQEECTPTLRAGVTPAVAYTMKIRSGCDVDASGKAAGKGALIQEDKSATLSTVQDQYLFQPITDTHILDDQGGSVINVREDGKAPTLRAQMNGHPPVVMEPMGLDLYNCAETGDKAATLTTQGGGTASGPSVCVPITVGLSGEQKVSPTLISRMETATGTTQDNLIICEPAPMMMEPTEKPIIYERGYGGKISIDGVSPTLEARMGTGGNNQPVICLQGNGIDRADTAGCNGKGWREDASYTLNTIDRPAVVYAVDQGGGKSGANVSEGTAPTLCTTHGGEPAVAYGLDRASFNQGQNAKFDFSVTEEQQPCLTARGPGAVVHASKASFFTRAGEGAADTLVTTDYKDPQIVAYEHHPRYIVRRLTPTECARLQGFADRWGCIEPKKTLTDEEHQFWMDVRNTHAAINGKRVQEYTKRQMLIWYNKLYTDSAEYKMWGNGIALPTALYVVQGIAEVLNRTIEEEDWML